MRITLRVKRFEMGKDRQPYWSEYGLEMEPTDRVLDALHEAKWRQDGTLSFRRSCAHGVCGSDAMLINGRNRLACKVLLRDVGDRITVEPLRGYPVIKDLVVDQSAFFQKYESVMPYFQGKGSAPERERLQNPEERKRFDDTTKCILCMACTTSCPAFWPNPDYLGPAAIVNAHRFIFDSRDGAAELRLDKMNEGDGVWRCRTIFNCVDACPREIKITRAIGQVKKALMLRRG